jgi:hypothetical protein
MTRCLAVVVGMLFRGVFVVFGGMQMMAMRDLGVMRRTIARRQNITKRAIMRRRIRAGVDDVHSLPSTGVTGGFSLAGIELGIRCSGRSARCLENQSFFPTQGYLSRRTGMGAVRYDWQSSYQKKRSRSADVHSTCTYRSSLIRT